jgi:hypothetical protein
MKLLALSSYLETHLQRGIAPSSLYNGSICHNFQEIHYIVVKRFLKYLCGATKYALCYYYVSTEHQIMLAYTEAKYAGDLNDHKSLSGSILFLNN